MDPTRVDTIAKLFATRRSRRALAQTGAVLAAALGAAGQRRATHAQDATPAAPTTSPPAEKERPFFLFLQAFRSGHVAAKEGVEGRYSLTLEQGLGQTVYFTDRPDRIVGATPTPEFLDGLGFPDDNPPNAALIVETAEGSTEVAVVELFSPSYDEASRTATYEVAVLAEWERTSETGEATFSETAPDLSAFGSNFGAAHLFIDDCANATITCVNATSQPAGTFYEVGMCWNYSTCEFPCEPYGHTQPDRCEAWRYWNSKCNQTFPSCAGNCRAQTSSPYWGMHC